MGGHEGNTAIDNFLQIIDLILFTDGRELPAAIIIF